MLKVADIEFMRRLYEIEGWSVRKIARQCHCSRKTVQKYVGRTESTEAPQYVRRSEPKAPKMDPYVALIDQWLKEDAVRPEKQRHTARRIYCRLVDEYGATVAESTVRRIVARRRAQVAPKAPRTFLVLTYEPGAVAQVDWGEVTVVVDGKESVAREFCMRLGYSTAVFVMLFPNERLECFLEGHVRAFEFFGGVPGRIIYDNLKSAVHRILHGRQRELNSQFLQLRAHYLFEVSSQPLVLVGKRGWSKGSWATPDAISLCRFRKAAPSRR